jgi:hypothetical protein
VNKKKNKENTEYVFSLTYMSIPPIPPMPPMPPMPPPGGGALSLDLDAAITSSILKIIDDASVAALITCSLTFSGS